MGYGRKGETIWIFQKECAELKPGRVHCARIPGFMKTDAVRITADYPSGREQRKGKHGRLQT